MENMSYKVYVDVVLLNDKNGDIRPLSIKLDNGKSYEITRVKNKCRASSLKVGGCGDRYTIVIKNKETYLFNDENKWFVESARPNIE